MRIVERLTARQLFFHALLAASHMTPRKLRPHLASFDRSCPDAPAPEVYPPCEFDAPADRAVAARDLVAVLIGSYIYHRTPHRPGRSRLNGHS
jgi:hypothetical protein